jgi:protein phosphatase
VYEEARRRRNRMGTTMVAAFIDLATSAVWIANVGDSRAYLLSGGEIRQVTEDHSMVAEQVAAGLMDEEQATHAPHQNVITRAVGIEPVVMVDVFGPRCLEPGELLLLSSDGLHRDVSDEEIREIACTTLFAALAGALVDAALARGGRDNITVVVGGQGLDSSQPSCLGGSRRGL